MLTTRMVESAKLSDRSNGPVVVVIPAYKPTLALVSLVMEINASGVRDIVVVDDGSGEESQPIFEHLREVPGCQLVRHAVNLGKGRALKTALNHVLVNCPQAAGVVTADADGQHSSKDICRLAEHLAEHPSSIVIGARTLSGEIPLRSYIGNWLTGFVFACLTGKSLRDTQSGLRALPARIIPTLLRLDGERYDFEMAMLFHAAKHGASVREVPIETIYIGKNESSHFHPLRDSAMIYSKVMRFYASSMLAALLDLAVFSIAISTTGNLLFSFLVGRILIAALVNYNINRRYVFESKANLAKSLLKYYLSFAVLAAVSFTLINVLRKAGVNPIFAKALIETSLSVLSFGVQGIYVFADRRIRSDNGAGPVAAV